MDLTKRKPTRLKGYDYSTPGAYFITKCTHNRKCLFSNIVWAIRESPIQYHRSVIDKMMGFIKMNVSKKIHNTDKEKIWQCSYYDHIIRGEKDCRMIWEYIDTNVSDGKKIVFIIEKRSSEFHCSVYCP